VAVVGVGVTSRRGRWEGRGLEATRRALIEIIVIEIEIGTQIVLKEQTAMDLH
jgi:hypothetical protein